MRLNRVNSAIDRTERNKLNENFDIIERGQSSIQNQINQLVIEGDSSVEAAQARVSLDDTVYNTLKERLDAENEQITQRLTETDEKFKNIDATIVNVKDYGAKGDYDLNSGTGTDDTDAIQNAINSTQSKGSITLLFPPGRYKITRSLNITRFNVEFKGSGMQTTELCYAGNTYNSTTNVGGETILNVYNGGAGSSRIIVQDISFHGGNKTKWCVKADGSSGIKFENVRFRHGWGHLQVLNSPLLNTKNCIFEYNTTQKPSDATTTDWETIKNLGLIHIYECHGYTFDKYFVYGAGHDEDTALRSVFYVQSTVVGNHIKGVIERDARYLAGNQQDNKAAVNHAFYLDTMVRNINIGDLYFEHMDVLSLLTSITESNANISSESIYVHMCSFYYYPFYFYKGFGFKVGKVYAWGTYFNERFFAYVDDVARENPITQEIYWHGGKKGGVHNRVTIDGKVYADPQVTTVGMAVSNAQLVSDGTKFIRVKSGLTVTTGEDTYGKYLAVSGGSIITHNGKNINVGITLSVGIVGWILRPNLEANASYNVCIDGYGGVWVEKIGQTNTHLGKAIIATFSTDESGIITNLATNQNVHRGYFINETSNKMIYTSAVPTFGTWSKGDRMVNVAGNAGGVSEYVCTVAGTPGTWKAAGVIES